MVDTKENQGMGWLPDYPDFRDYTIEREDLSGDLSRRGEKEPVRSMVSKVGLGAETIRAPAAIDLRQWCSPIEDQGATNSCTANAGVGLVEYFERRAHGKHLDASRLFLYKATRNLLKWEGDTGAFLRTAMSAMVLFGVPPEEYWPFDAARVDDEPPAFCYAFAQNFQTMQYFRLDPPQTASDRLLSRIKAFLTAGIPPMFGFTVFRSIWQARPNGEIPFPSDWERRTGGHAVVAVGYDDSRPIKNIYGGETTTGALLIRNSWGTGWGEDGYGWLPYDYVLRGLAIDWWTVLKNEWVDTGRFKA